MILIILDFKGRRLEVPSASRSAKHMIFGAPEGVKGGPWGPRWPIGPPGYLRFPKEKQWFCVFKQRVGDPLWVH